MNFAEGKKTSAAEWFKEFLKTLPQQVEFSEIAKKEKAKEKTDEVEKTGKDIASRVG